MKRVLLFVAIILSVCPVVAQQPSQEVLDFVLDLRMNYGVTGNIVYSTASGYDCKLDVYQRRNVAAPVPVVVNIHGGGWVGGTKEGNTMELLPYLALGFSVVNVEYRMARNALAPAAVEDCRLALRWVIKNAKTYNFDTSKIVVTGGSAGGHLALMTGMLNLEAGFDSPKEWDQEMMQMHVAAIINWFGITDVKDLLSGENRQGYAVSWIGAQENGARIAERVSPLSYIRKDLPPILTIHGTKDQLVPYAHATRLHAALDKAGVMNRLITIPDGKHGGFTREQMLMIFANIREFLKTAHVLQ
jgi:acetyl esterase/lipase